MAEITLQSTIRQTLGKKVKNLRREGQIPAVLYGANFKPLAITLPQKQFIQITREAGEATLINLEIPKQEPAKILIRNIQKHPVTDEIIHVDLYKVDMKQSIQTEIPLEFTGVAPAVEELEGNFVSNKDSIKVECLPQDLVPKIEVDISILKTFEDLIHISELKIPKTIKVLDEADTIICQVTPPRSEEELEAMEGEAKAAAETEKAQIEGIESEAEAEKAAKTAEKELVETEKPVIASKPSKETLKEK